MTVSERLTCTRFHFLPSQSSQRSHQAQPRTDVEGSRYEGKTRFGFVPEMRDCRILKRYWDGLLREIDIRGNVMRERVVFAPETEVYFERVYPPDGGWTTNVISDSNRGLMLTFTFAQTLPGRRGWVGRGAAKCLVAQLPTPLPAIRPITARRVARAIDRSIGE
jgi:Domain of unknown function (DUF1857)